MATRLITNDAQLRRYMPNVFATAQGETPLFDKVLPWLETAERWLFSMSWDFSITASCHTQIIERLRSVIVSALQGNTLNIQSLRDIVDFMRKHDAQFSPSSAVRGHTNCLSHPFLRTKRIITDISSKSTSI